MNERGRRVYLLGLILLTATACSAMTFRQATDGSILGLARHAKAQLEHGSALPGASLLRYVSGWPRLLGAH